MKIHIVASQPHYRDHCEAIWKHLPGGMRGEIRFGHGAHARDLPTSDLVMVGAFIDIERAHGRRVVFVEHGAGQSYQGLPTRAQAYYTGGSHPDNVVAYLGPREETVYSWGKPAYPTGCPIMDPYQLFGEDKVVAITFHWPARRLASVVPEVGTAFNAWIHSLPLIVDKLLERDWTVLGHHHPRFRHLATAWKHMGVPVADVDEVRRRASVLIADNTSLMYEMMYCGRTVVALDSPAYRPDVEHGLRFWDHAPARRVGHLSELEALISTDFADQFGEATDADFRTTSFVYGRPFSDGGDGQRGAAWLATFATGL